MLSPVMISLPFKILLFVLVDGWNLITRGLTQRVSIMTLDNISTILNDGIQTIIITSLPSVGVGLIVGLIIALFQAVTQIQEQTLTFVPKMVAVFLIVAATFPWMAGTIIEMTTNLWTQIPVYSR